MRAVSISPSFGPRLLEIRIVGTVTPHEAVRVQELLEVARTYYGYETVALRFSDAGATPRSAAMLLAAVTEARSAGVAITCARDGQCGRHLAQLFPDTPQSSVERTTRLIGFSADSLTPRTRA